MKKINKKGFTLIELLAVIIILGIVMVLTIPSVIDSMNNAKYKQLQNAANTVADWLLEQYTIYQMDPDSCDSVFINKYMNDSYKLPVIDESFNFSTGASGTSYRTVFFDIQEAAGLSDARNNFLASNTTSSGSSVFYSIAFYNSTKGKVCVRLKAKSGGQFYNSGSSDEEKSKNVAYSSGCPALTGSFATKWGPLVTQS